MSSIGAGYDLCASTFSPDGRVFQVEYAQKAAENSSTAIGLRGKDGIVFAVEKLVASRLHEAGAENRIFTVDKHIGIATAGLVADARQIVEIARNEASNFRSEYNKPIPIKQLKDRVAMYMHVYTLGHMRPFGASVLMAAHSAPNGPEMYCVDSAGNSYGYFGCAIGKAKQAAETEMEQLKLKDMTCAKLVKEAAKIVYLVHDDVKDKNFELELSWVGDITKGIHRFVPDRVFQEAEKYARAAVEDESESDEDM